MKAAPDPAAGSLFRKARRYARSAAGTLGLGHPLYVNGHLFPEPVTISHVPGATGSYYDVPAGYGDVDPSMGGMGAYVAYAAHLGADELPGASSASLPPGGAPMSTTQIILGLVGTAAGAAGIYHGYKRNDSIGWALWWGLMGAAFPIITIPIALAQGFGERKGMTSNRSRRRNGRKGALTPRETIQRAARAAKRAGFDNVNEFSAAYAAKLGRLGLSSDDAWHIWLAAWNAAPSPKKKSWRGNRRRR